ncbi:MAG: 3-methyladenine DNA glycosylase 2, partial [Acidobacteriota bacterium]|nr:3-methyladenine DNA glycosylase 2 [Acidobacteriota bacterium]
MRSITIHLPYTGAYDWAAALRFFAARAVDGVEQVEGGLYRRTIRIDEDSGLLEVAPAGSERALRATVQMSRAVDDATVMTRLRQMFDLDADLSVINAHLSTDASMSRLVAARPALCVFGGWDPFEVAMRTINGQQVSVERARHLNGVLVVRAGATPRLSRSKGLNRLFPTPHEVIAADLAGMGMPGARVATLRTMAAAAIADPRLFATTGSLDETIARLRGIKGIGEWTAHYIAMRACRQPDAFPASDVGLLR